MASEICLIAPYEDLSQVAIEVSASLAGDFDIKTANLEEALHLLPKLEAEGYQVLISRGKTAELLRRNTALPVIDIRVHSYDILRIMADLIGKPRRVAFVGYVDVMRDCKKIADILNISSYAILFDQPDALDYERLQDVVRDRLARDPVDLMIGDTIPQSRFAPLCNEFRLISSGPESIREAVESATALLKALKLEKVNRRHLSTVLDMFEKAVFSLDEVGRITHANHTAASVFQMNRGDMLGLPIEAVDPAFSIAHESIGRGVFEVGQVVETRQGRMLCYLYPIITGGVRHNIVFALERLERLYALEQKARHQERQQGRFLARHRLEDYLTEEPEMQSRLKLIKRFARTEANILITGESGTGKELLAQGIHNASRRSHGPFVAVNCGALPPTLLESELFGYVEGAFTGASRKGKKGVFELAYKGTLFLDEIGELDKALQPRLLRVIQERELMRLGSEQPVLVDIRLIAASNRNLEEMVAAGEFRPDLFYRLNVLKFDTLPLRERRRDIVASALLLLRKHAHAHGSPAHDLDEDLRRMLENYDWPGNFRQLGNIMERVAIIASQPMVSLREAMPVLGDLRSGPSAAPKQDEETLATGTMNDVRRRVVTQIMAQENITKAQAARRLGVDRTTLNRWLKDMG
jgi:transcriptional regulator with PAS, ATPase and Fis domain